MKRAVDWEEVCVQAPMPLLVFGVDGVLLHLNEAAARTFEGAGPLEPDQLSDRPGSDVFPFLRDSAFEGAFRELSEAAPGSERTFPAFVPEGSSPSQVTLRRLRSDAIACFYQNTTELGEQRKATHEKLAQAQSRLLDLDALLDLYPFGSIATFDESLRYLSVRGQGWAELGVDPRDLEGKRFDVLWEESTAKDLGELAQVALEGRQAMTRISFRDGIYEIWAGPLPSTDGVGSRGLFVSRDVTLEARTADEARLVRQGADAASLGITLVDLDAPDQPLIYANKGFERVTGYRADEILGRNCRFLQGSDTDSATTDRIREAIRRGEGFQGTILNYKKDGTPFWNRLTLTPFPKNPDAPSTRRYVGIQEDVTEIRETEVERNHQRRLAEVGTLTGSIAHDFNNILMESGGRVAICLKEAEDVQLRSELFELDKALERGKTLIRELLAYARRTTPTDEQDAGPALIRDCVSGINRLLPYYVQVEFACPDEKLPVPLGPLRVEQLLLNLAKNAADAMPEGGVLRITVEHDDEPGWVRCMVQDEGVGMPDEVKARAFDPFFSTKGSRGTGLGLASVRLIVEAAGGTIEVGSTVGEGTTFTLRLPKATAPVPGAGPSPRERLRPARLEGLRVLIVEDQPGIRNVLRRLLKRRGLIPVTAPDGRAGLERYESAKEPFDIIIADREMPHMTGDRLLREISDRSGADGHPWLVLMSGDLNLASTDTPSETTMVQKPFDVEELIEILEAEVASADRED